MTDTDPDPPDDAKDDEPNAKNARTAANTQGVGGGDVADRSRLASMFGNPTQFDGDRDIYETLGYQKTLTVDDYLRRYNRQDIAKRIVNAPADKTWQEQPDAVDDDDSDEESDFEADVRSVFDDTGALKALRDTDRFAGIGYVGALVIGFADSAELSEPVDVGSLPDDPEDAIAYYTPCHEGAIDKVELVTDDSDPRFGEPERFTIDFAAMDALEDSSVVVDSKARVKDVHHSRVIMFQPEHPRLQPVFNRLDDLEKVTGASAELFWRGADYGLALNLDSKAAAAMSTEQRRDLQDDIETEAEAYYHGLQPFLKLAGVDVERLGGEAVDPTGIADLLLQLIAGTVEMPKRILTGSERGELASTQDRASWLGTISQRQTAEVEPGLFRPFIDRLVDFALVAAPTGDRYDVEWPNLFELNDVERAEVMAQKAGALKAASGALVASSIATEGEVRQEIFDWSPVVGAETGEAPDDAEPGDPLPDEADDVPTVPEVPPDPDAPEPPFDEEDIDEDDDGVREAFESTKEMNGGV